MTAHLKDVAAKCPNTKFVMGGHSQGGVVTVQVINALPVEILKRTVAITSFGSPDCPASLAKAGIADRCISFCHSSDSVSSQQIVVTSDTNKY
jgi:Cutinase